MARQFFIAPRIGVGTREDPFRPKVPGNVSAFISECNETQCLVLVTGDTSAAAGDPQLAMISAADFDREISTLTNPERNRINNAMSAKGIDVGPINDYATVRDYLNAIGSIFIPNFSVDLFFAPGE